MKLYTKLYSTLTAAVVFLGMGLATYDAYGEISQEKPVKSSGVGHGKSDKKKPNDKQALKAEQLAKEVEQFETLKQEYTSAATCRERAQVIRDLVTSDPGRKFMGERIDQAIDLEEMMAIASEFMNFVDAPLDKGLPLSFSYYKSLHSKFLMRLAQALYQEEQKLDAEAKAEAYNNRPWCQDHGCYIPKKDIYMVHKCPEFLFQPVDCQIDPNFNRCKSDKSENNDPLSDEFTALCNNFGCGVEMKFCDMYDHYKGCTSIRCKPDFGTREYVCEYNDRSYTLHGPMSRDEAKRKRWEYELMIRKKLKEESDSIKRDH